MGFYLKAIREGFCFCENVRFDVHQGHRGLFLRLSLCFGLCFGILTDSLLSLIAPNKISENRGKGRPSVRDAPSGQSRMTTTDGCCLLQSESLSASELHLCRAQRQAEAREQVDSKQDDSRSRHS